MFNNKLKIFSFRSIGALLLLFALFSFKESQNKTTFDGAHFSITYPADWKIENANDLVNIFPAHEIGAITISGYEGVQLDQEGVKNLIVEITGLPDVHKDVSVKNRNGFAEYYHEYDDAKNNMHWITKIYIKKNDMHLVTINCESKYWNGVYRMMFLDALKSYKPKN